MLSYLKLGNVSYLLNDCEMDMKIFVKEVLCDTRVILIAMA